MDTLSRIELSPRTRPNARLVAGAGMTLTEGREGTAVGLRDREQGPVEVTELTVHPSKSLLPLGQPQAVEVRDDVAGKSEHDGDGDSDHVRRS
jgi:hypothetical protein